MLEQLAYLSASWAMLAGAAWKFFERVEKVTTPEAKAAVRRLVFERDLEKHLNKLALSCALAFDAVFGERHFTWRCFRRSALASFVFAGALLALSMALDARDVPETLAEALEIDESTGAMTRAIAVTAYGAFMLAFAGIFNVIPDYFSLLKSRAILRRLESANGVAAALWVVLDMALSASIGFLSVAVLMGLFSFLDDYTDTNPVWWPDGGWRDLPSYVLDDGVFNEWEYFHDVLSMNIKDVDGQAGVWFYATFLTAVWVFLYMIAVVLIRISALTSLGWQTFHRWVDVQRQPFLSMGIVVITLITISFLVGAPIAFLLRL